MDVVPSVSPRVTRSKSRNSSADPPSTRSNAGSGRNSRASSSPGLVTQEVASSGEFDDSADLPVDNTEEEPETGENLETEDENRDGEDSNNGEDDEERENGESEEEEDQQPTTGKEVNQQKAGDKVDQQAAGENVVIEKIGVEGEGEEREETSENSTNPPATSSSRPVSPKFVVLRGRSFSRVDGSNLPSQVRTTVVQKRKLDTTPVNSSENKRMIHFTAPMVLYHSNRVLKLAQDGLTLGSGEPNDVTNSREVTAEQVVLQLSAGE
jgi:hypothetical protein